MIGKAPAFPLVMIATGGLFVSQILTLYTTPVIYLLIDRLRQKYKFIPEASPAN